MELSKPWSDFPEAVIRNYAKDDQDRMRVLMKGIDVICPGLNERKSHDELISLMKKVVIEDHERALGAAGMLAAHIASYGPQVEDAHVTGKSRRAKRSGKPRSRWTNEEMSEIIETLIVILKEQHNPNWGRSFHPVTSLCLHLAFSSPWLLGKNVLTGKAVSWWRAMYDLMQYSGCLDLMVSFAARNGDDSAKKEDGTSWCWTNIGSLSFPFRLSQDATVFTGLLAMFWAWGLEPERHQGLNVAKRMVSQLFPQRWVSRQDLLARSCEAAACLVEDRICDRMIIMVDDKTKTGSLAWMLANFNFTSEEIQNEVNEIVGDNFIDKPDQPIGKGELEMVVALGNVWLADCLRGSLTPLLTRQNRKISHDDRINLIKALGWLQVNDQPFTIEKQMPLSGETVYHMNTEIKKGLGSPRPSKRGPLQLTGDGRHQTLALATGWTRIEDYPGIRAPFPGLCHYESESS